MLKLVRALGCLTAMALAGSALAQVAWTPLFDGSGEDWSYDPASVQRAGAVTTVTLRVQFSTPQTIGGNSVQWGTERVALNCQAKTYVDVGLMQYNAAGTLVYQSTTPGQSQPFTAGSPGGLVAAKVC